MKMRIRPVWVIAALLFCFSAGSCREREPQPDTQKIEVQISIRTEISAALDEEIVFRYYGGGASEPSVTDCMVFKAADGKEYVCPITRVGEGTLSFRIAQPMPSAVYELFFRRGRAEKHLSKVRFHFIERSVVADKEGCSVYGRISCGDKGVSGVTVSDGVEVTQTDADGVYYLHSDKKYGYVWLSVPGGYEPPVKGILPVFWQPLEMPASVHERRDFELEAADNDRFTLYVLGDMHLANRLNDLVQFAEFAEDLRAEMAGASGRKYALTLGDMTWDLYWYDHNYGFAQYLDTMERSFKDLPVFHTMGNHDNDFHRIGDFNKEIPYRTRLTPTYYSFNLGKIHFIVLDDIDYNETGTGDKNRRHYKCNFTSDQMDWLRKDLSYVDKGTPVILSTHAPVFRPSPSGGFRPGLSGADAPGEGDTKELIEALKGRTVHFFTAHTHMMFNYDRLEEERFYEHNAGSICGSWWWCGYLTSGINLGQDGSPSGYTILEAEGKEFRWKYKAVGYPESCQFRAYDMNEVRKAVTMESAGGKSGFRPFVEAVGNHDPNTVLLNVWNWDDRWTVEVTENGKRLDAAPRYDMDPLHILAMTAKRFKSTDSPNFTTLPWTHFFEVTASAPDTELHIKVTDRFGSTFEETMKRPKPFTTASYRP